MVTPDELQQIRARAEAATPGPWRIRTGTMITSDWAKDKYKNSIIIHSHFPPFARGADAAAVPIEYPENAAFIAAARTDIPALLAEVERLQKRIEALQLDAAHRSKVVAELQRDNERLQRENERLDNLIEITKYNCECAPDEACEFARQRDEAQRELAQLRAPLTLEQAVEVLNNHAYRGLIWRIDGPKSELSAEGRFELDGRLYRRLTEFEAIAIAQAYLREGK